MKLGKLITGFVLSTLLAVGVGVGIGSANKETKTARADVWPQAPTIYFCPSDNWISSNAVFQMHYWNSNESSWQKGDIDGVATSVGYSNRTVYKFTVTNSSHYPNKIQFVRLKSDKSETWNRSGDISISDYYNKGVNTVIMDAGHSWWSTWNIGTEDESGNNIYWLNSSFKVNLNSECNTPSSSTTRVFVYNSGTHWSSSGKTAIEAWGGSASVSFFTGTTVNSIYNLTWIKDDNSDVDKDRNWYGYADIPTDLTVFRLVELTAENDVGAHMVADDYYSQNLTLGGDDGWQNSVIYCPAQGNTVTKGGAHSDSCGAELITTVLKAIDTCSSSELNGYNSYSRINNYYYSHASDAAKNTKVKTLGTLAKELTVTEHVLGMASRVSPSNITSRIFLFDLNSNQGNSALIVIISSIATVAAFAGYFFYKKKKED